MTPRLSAIELRPSYLMRRKHFSLVSSLIILWVPTVEGANPWKATTEYVSDNEHAFVSSSEVSACSVEPGTAQDVSLIVRRSNTAVDRDLTTCDSWKFWASRAHHLA